MTIDRSTENLETPEATAIRGDSKQPFRPIGAVSPMANRPHEPGGRVRVHSGIFEGVEGTILRRLGDSRLEIAVHLLQAGVSLEIDAHLLQAIE